jgi:hypothetical protein
MTLERALKCAHAMCLRAEIEVHLVRWACLLGAGRKTSLNLDLFLQITVAEKDYIF